MNSIDSSGAPSAPEAGSKVPQEQQVVQLQRMLLATLVLVVALSAVFNLFLLRQWMTLGQETRLMEAQVGPVVVAWQQREEPALKGFYRQLLDYSKTHPDIAPLLSKYQLTNLVAHPNPATARSSGAGTPATGPVPR